MEYREIPIFFMEPGGEALIIDTAKHLPARATGYIGMKLCTCIDGHSL